MVKESTTEDILLNLLEIQREINIDKEFGDLSLQHRAALKAAAHAIVEPGCLVRVTIRYEFEVSIVLKMLIDTLDRRNEIDLEKTIRSMESWQDKSKPAIIELKNGSGIELCAEWDRIVSGEQPLLKNTRKTR